MESYGKEKRQQAKNKREKCKKVEFSINIEAPVFNSNNLLEKRI